MTDLDWPPVEPDPSAIEREPKRCKHIRTWRVFEPLKVQEPGPLQGVTKCGQCGKVIEDAAIRRGKTSRNRGNAFEREVAAKLGGIRKGQFGDKVDVEVPGYLRVQCKNGTAYPERIDGWLRAIPVQAGIMRAVVIGDAPGAGNRRRSLIVFDLDDWASNHGTG